MEGSEGKIREVLKHMEKWREKKKGREEDGERYRM